MFTATTDNDSLATRNAVSLIYRLSINGGDAVQLVKDEYSYGSPAFSPDGKYLFCLAGKGNNNHVYNLSHLVRFDWPSLSNRKVLLPALDRPINSFTVKKDKIVMSVEDQGNDKIMVIDYLTGSVNELNGMSGSYTGVSSSADAKTIVSNYENASMPAEIIRILPSNTFLTHFNDAAIASLDMQTPEEFWTATSRGKKIRSLLVKPAGFNPSKNTRYLLLCMVALQDHGKIAGVIDGIITSLLRQVMFWCLPILLVPPVMVKNFPRIYWATH